MAEPVRVRAAAASDRARIAAINREGQPGVNPLSAAELDACLARATLFCVAELERVARRSGIPQLVCEVNLRPANPRSLAFHAALGFVEVGQLEVSDGRRVALLERALVQSPR